jgi:hypothetical protein
MRMADEIDGTAGTGSRLRTFRRILEGVSLG